MNNKLILTDCDGVLLDWIYSFDQWMKKHGYRIKTTDCYSIEERYDIPSLQKRRLTRMFNESAWIRKLPPFYDAIKYVRKLHEEHGYIFHVITSQTDVEYAQHLRIKNLCEMFGPTVFDKYVFLDCGADKDEALLEYKDSECWWIEDKPENADVGLSVGLKSILMAHDHNADYKGQAFRLNSWREIHDLVTGEIIYNRGLRSV